MELTREVVGGRSGGWWDWMKDMFLNVHIVDHMYGVGMSCIYLKIYRYIYTFTLHRVYLLQFIHENM